jgi:FkbM family methyltransferase
MLISIDKIIKEFKLDIKGIIHIGAGSGAEIKDYSKLKTKNFLLIEPDLRNYYKLYLRKIYYSFFFNKKINLERCVITNKIKNTFLNIMNVRDCNSVLNLKLHKKIYPEIKKIKSINIKSLTLNYLFKKKYNIKNFNFINIDIQGAELLAFNGATKILDYIDAIYTEVNFKELYKNGAMVSKLDKFLKKFNFTRVYTNCSMDPSWGDALYIKNIKNIDKN